MQVYTLSQVTRAVQRAVEARAAGRWIWVKAEMVKLNYFPHSGHCYPDFVERRDGRVIAQMRGTIWADDYEQIARQFRKVVGTPLQDGMELLLEATVRFHPVYGLSLHVRRIDPQYSLGGLLRRRREAIERLKKEGLFDRNREKTLSWLPRVLAVVSVETSKGYRDFRSVIDHAPYAIVHKLFPALLQGEGAVRSIARRLRQIARYPDVFDAVLIVRGGGGEVGLAAYDDYELAREIALHPLPVLTGIGHSTNRTVAEMVSWRSFITPTDMARFVVGRFEEATDRLADLSERTRRSAAYILKGEKEKQHQMGRRLHTITRHQLSRQAFGLDHQRQRMQAAVRSLLHGAAQRLNGIERTIQALSPRNILKRGYTLTVLNGKIVTSVETVRKGQVVKTLFKDGQAESLILKTEKDERKPDV